MDRESMSRALPLKEIRVTDPFWKGEMELVRTEVIPYQWEALNDRIEGAAPSYCMHNFKVAAKMNQEKKELGDAYVPPVYTPRGFESLPEDPAHPEDQFYGCVFQDSDFSKWIEAVGYSLTQHPDAELERIADQAIDLVCAAQQEDGYLDTFYIINGRDKTFTNLRDHHELYCFGHLVEGAVSYYQATGKDKLLKAAMRFADYVDENFGPEEGKKKGYPGHEIAEMALVRLYEVTGEERYLNLSRFFINQRGQKPYYFDGEDHSEQEKRQLERIGGYQYYQSHLPVREQDEAVGHAVRAMYLYSGMADVARLTQDESLAQACERLWESVTKEKMYLTGGVGGTHIGEAFSYPYDLPNDTAYAETCASIGLVFFARRMLQLKPEVKYADVMERALYNTILSGMALDGKSFFYVNPLEVNPEACAKDARKEHVKPVRQKWFGCACCPPNLARLISSVASYAYTENDDTLFVHLYMGSALTRTVNGKKAEISVESSLPWEGTVRIQVRAQGTGLKLALRIPDWCCGSYQSDLPGHLQAEEQDGYLYVSGEWMEEDVLCLSFSMEPQAVAADPRVREDIGRAAVMRGPIVYCLEEQDNGPDLHLLSIDPKAAPTVSDETICGAEAKTICWPGWRQEKKEQEQDGLYRTWSEEVRSPVSLHFIPYYMWANRGENEMQVWTRVSS